MARRNRISQQDRYERKNKRGRNVSDRAVEESYLAKPITPMGVFQKDLLFSIQNSMAVFVNAPAGCGKTFVVMSTVIDWLKQGKIKKVILSRPTVGMGNSLGLLPGEIRAKLEPYLMPLIQVIEKRYGKGFYETQLSNGNIEFAPFEYIRGRSFDDTVVIVDEFQNTDEDSAYTVITRLGSNSKLFCLGDHTQNDVRKTITGLEWAIDFIDRHNLYDYADTIEGTSDDIVRGDFVREVVKARERDLREGRV